MVGQLRPRTLRFLNGTTAPSHPLISQPIVPNHGPRVRRLVEDTAWHPVQESEMEKWDPTSASIYKFFLGTPLKLWASVGHWWIWHFDLKKYTEKQKPRVGGLDFRGARVLLYSRSCVNGCRIKLTRWSLIFLLLQVLVSLAAVAIAAFVGLPTLAYYTGIWGVVKYWLMPWLGYHFWMSTFTVIHHTAPHIPFKVGPAAGCDWEGRGVLGMEGRIPWGGGKLDGGR